MDYTIHGKTFNHYGECGIFTRGLDQTWRYTTLHIEGFLRTVESLPRDEAIQTVASIKHRAIEQREWFNPNKNIPEPVNVPSSSLYELPKYIGNTQKLTGEVLTALCGN